MKRGQSTVQAPLSTGFDPPETHQHRNQRHPRAPGNRYARGADRCLHRSACIGRPPIADFWGLRCENAERSKVDCLEHG